MMQTSGFALTANALATGNVAVARGAGLTNCEDGASLH
jgi:hypothetical protein